MSSSDSRAQGSSPRPWLGRFLWVYVPAMWLLFLVALVIQAAHIGSPLQGDELFYRKVALRLQEAGYAQALCEGNPITFSVLIAVLMRAGLPVVAAGRIVGFLSALLLLLGVHHLFWRCCEWGAWLKHFLFLMAFQLIARRVPFDFAATLLVTALAWWAVVLAWKGVFGKGRWHDWFFAGALLALALLTRDTAAFVILGLVAAGGAELVRAPERRWRLVVGAALLAGAFLAVFLLAQAPSLVRNGTITLESAAKMQHPGEGKNWWQFHGLRAIELKQGHADIAATTDPWTPVDLYLAAHGADSLPKTAAAFVLANPGFVLREGLKNATIRAPWTFLKKAGVLSLLLPLYLWPQYRRARRDSRFLLLTLVVPVLAVAFVGMNEMADRWIFVPLLLVYPLAGHVLQELLKRQSRWCAVAVLAQSAFLVVASLHYFPSLVAHYRTASDQSGRLGVPTRFSGETSVAPDLAEGQSAHDGCRWGDPLARGAGGVRVAWRSVGGREAPPTASQNLSRWPVAGPSSISHWRKNGRTTESRQQPEPFDRQDLRFLPVHLNPVLSPHLMAGPRGAGIRRPHHRGGPPNSGLDGVEGIRG